MRSETKNSFLWWIFYFLIEEIVGVNFSLFVVLEEVTRVHLGDWFICSTMYIFGRRDRLPGQSAENNCWKIKKIKHAKSLFFLILV